MKYFLLLFLTACTTVNVAHESISSKELIEQGQTSCGVKTPAEKPYCVLQFVATQCEGKKLDIRICGRLQHQ